MWKRQVVEEGWFENERCTSPFNVECWRKQDCTKNYTRILMYILLFFQRFYIHFQ